MPRRLLLTAAGVVLALCPVRAQTDLDEFMAQVLERRDENWKKLQQYVLDERELLQVTGLDGAPLFGFRREYTWFPRDGVFIRSPTRADGVEIGEAERRRQEEDWLRRELRRERRREARERRDGDAGAGPDPGPDEPAEGPPSTDAIGQALEPGFVSMAYFLDFEFDQGQYALAGRERRDGREVLRIEYYPTRLFSNDGPRRRERDEREERIEEQMDRASLVTLWIDRETGQILEYTFENLDWDFLPGSAFVRVGDVRASMRMGEAFENVWLPARVEMRFDLTTALGPIDARYAVDYVNYRLAEVTTRVR